MLVILLLVVLLAESGNTEKGKYILEPESSGTIFEDPNYIHYETNVARINKTHRAMNSSITFYTDVPDNAVIDMKVSALLSNRFVPMAIVIRRPFCEYLAKELQFVMSGTETNVSTTCPIPKGNYYYYNYIPVSKSFPKEIETDRFPVCKFTTVFFYGDKKVLEHYWVIKMHRIG